ncbi:MAG: GTPase domain-containing protein [Acidobacteriota bacterium]
MALVDPDTGCLSLQIVYDGAPLSGKTSSVVALGRLVDCPVVTPEEAQGRTVYFDWLDYTGGLCRGRPVQCRVIAVPGQDELAQRRDVILRGADAVVFVADTAAARFDDSCRRLEALRRQLAERRRKIPVLLQLNKRDLADAVPIDALVAQIEPELERVESVALTGAGIREAFVLAVSAAVRTLRSSELLYDSGVFDTQELQLPTPDQLLELLQTV